MNYYDLVPRGTILIGYVIILEACLIYVNYVARVKYPDYFFEMSPLWRRLDKKNVTLSVFIHPLVVLLPALFFYRRNWTEGLAFLVGIVGTNFAIDFLTVSQKMICIYRYFHGTGGKCDNLEAVKECMVCLSENAGRYKVGFPSLKVKEVKKR